MLQRFSMLAKNSVLSFVNFIQSNVFTVFRVSYNILTWPPKRAQSFLIFAVDYLLNKSKTTIQKCLFIWSMFVMLVSISCLLYAVFYTVYVPTAEISRPVHLSFSVCSTGIGICSFPSANVTFWNDEHTFQEVLGSGQAYSVTLELQMPDSLANRNLGMFMVIIKMFDREGNVSATSQRSALYKYRSVIMRVIDMVMYCPFYFLGLMEQKQILQVELFPHFVDDYYRPSVGAAIEIHSHKIEIYFATLKLLAKFTGLKYFLYYWPVVSTLSAFWVNLLILTTCMLVVLHQRREAMKQIAEGANEVDSKSEEDPSETTTSLMTSFDERHSTEQSTQTKTSDDDEDPDLYDLPLVQEPADFALPEGNEEIDTELRYRRIN